MPFTIAGAVGAEALGSLPRSVAAADAVAAAGDAEDGGLEAGPSAEASEDTSIPRQVKSSALGRMAHPICDGSWRPSSETKYGTNAQGVVAAVASRRIRKSGAHGVASDPEAVRAAAVRLLARRDFSCAELTERLLGDGCPRDLVEVTVVELRQGRILDDARYAQHYVAYHADRGQGPDRLAAALEERGLAPGLIEAALRSGPDWCALAREVRLGRFGLAPPRTRAEKVRQARFLQYRGFSADHIRSALGPDFDPDD